MISSKLVTLAAPEVMAKLMDVVEEQAKKIVLLEKKEKLLNAWMEYGDCTCLTCADNTDCAWAWGVYNVNGDCLAVK